MNNTPANKEFREFITEDYDKLLSMCKRLAPDDPSGLLNETLIYLLGKDTSSIRNYFTYTYVALKTQAYSPNSTFNRNIRSNKTDLPLLDEIVTEIEDETAIEDIETFDLLILKLNKLEKDGTLTWYENKLFKLMYAYETENDIGGLSLAETLRKRKMSYRRLGQEVNINAKSIWNTTNKVLEILKKEVKNG